MKSPPPFFEPIRLQAERRWAQLEADPELAGPWHQLFKQVQSPRHILSELLQNADDAGASQASAVIEDGCFVFSHNGDDFTEDHFASLCRFGYSNKRALHTIGFRGIGFKSTFSLGNRVELRTPSLSIYFDAHRFTQPHWSPTQFRSTADTEVRVPIDNEHKRRELEKNLEEWVKSPFSLLFFKNIRSLTVGERLIRWGSRGEGPVHGSEWMVLSSEPSESFLVVRSEEVPFPPESLAEIRQERMLSDDSLDFPPSKVEIVLGAAGRLYVVLPTGVETTLPFASNAPFIQDPARVKIKDPETSPTNRWLLDRIGRLAGAAMVEWLQHENSTIQERSLAYRMIPDFVCDENTVQGVSAAIASVAFTRASAGAAILITNTGELRKIGEAVAVPWELLEVWPEETVAQYFDERHRPALSRHVSNRDLDVLVRHRMLDSLSKREVIETLCSKHLPKPVSWGQLLRLWRFIAADVYGHKAGDTAQRVRILPVQGEDRLHAAIESVRLGEKKLLHSDLDWNFLSAHLIVINQNWGRFLADQRREAEENHNQALAEDVAAAYAVLKAMGRDDASNVSVVIEQVAHAIHLNTSTTSKDWVRLAQISAKLGATVHSPFCFVTQDGAFHASEEQATLDLAIRWQPNQLHAPASPAQDAKDAVVFDVDGTLAAFFPDAWNERHLLHADYSTCFQSCSFDEWRSWVASGKGGVHTFAPISSQSKNFNGIFNAKEELSSRGVPMASYSFPTSRGAFVMHDWDFEQELWDFWATLAVDDEGIWARILERIAGQANYFLASSKSARLFQMAANGVAKAVTSEPLLSGWVLKFRNLACLSDTRGFYRKPDELLRRTPETEAFMDVEPFVHGRLDTEATRPLLRLLGVQDVPTGPDRLLGRLRALSKAESPPIHEVEKWCRRLDQMVESGSTAAFMKIKSALLSEKLILSADVDWSTSIGVFLSTDDADVLGAPQVHPALRDLALWRRIGIAERPSADQAIAWLKALPSGQQLPPDDLRRVQSLLRQHAMRIWTDCEHWLNLSGQWIPVESMQYALSMQTLVPWSHLYEWVKQKTADFQRLSAELTELPPFANLPHLGRVIQDRLSQQTGAHSLPIARSWLNQFGLGLARVILDDEEETLHVREMATELSETMWRIAPGISLVPYIAGTPAGTPRSADVVWIDRVLYVDQLPDTKLARLVPQRLGASLGRPEITAALYYCFDRSDQQVCDYLEANFTLAPRVTPIREDRVRATPLSSNEADPFERLLLDDGSTSSDVEVTAPPANLQAESDAPQNVDAESGFVPVSGRPDEELVADPINNAVSTKEFAKSKQLKLRLIERFARSRGFAAVHGDRFRHSDGSWIGKTDGNRFPWERRTRDGELVCFYWPRELSLDLESMQLDADVWALLESSPKMHRLVLLNSQGEPIEMPGLDLLTLRASGKLKLHPDTYRLVLNHDHR